MAKFLINPGGQMMLTPDGREFIIGNDGDPCCCGGSHCYCNASSISGDPTYTVTVPAIQIANMVGCIGVIPAEALTYWTAHTTATYQLTLTYADGADVGGHPHLVMYYGGDTSYSEGISGFAITICVDQATCEFVLRYYDTYGIAGSGVITCIWEGRKSANPCDPTGIYTRVAGCCTDATKTVVTP